MDRAMDSTTIDFRGIQQDACKQALEAEGETLALGQPVAWAERRFGRTDGLSVVHRAGGAALAMTSDQHTLCGEVVPAAILRVALSPNLCRSLGRCRYCDEAYTKTGPQALNGAAA